jgi:transposase
VTRFIGIRHRIKRTAKGEARPTQVVIVEGGKSKSRKIDLKNEDEELDFVLGRLPTRYGTEEEFKDAITTVLKRHVKTTETGQRAPSAYDGFTAGDVIAVVAGGSGGNLSFALSRRAEEIGAEVLCIPCGSFKDRRGDADKDDDALTLAKLAREFRTELFKPVTRRDRDLIFLVETWRDREDAMKARIAAEQRLRQRLIGKIFRSAEGFYPEGAIEDAFDAARSNDVIVQALLKEENRLKVEVEKAICEMPVYSQFLANVEGCGPLVAARIISAAGDIRRFATIEGFKAYLGVHIREGAFPRRQAGKRSNWNDLGRQGFYLLADQFVKRKDSEWGLKLRAYKVQFREKHPVEIKEGKRTLYTTGHIHRMAIWRTVTRFAEALYREWRRIEGLAGPAQTPKKKVVLNIDPSIPAGAKEIIAEEFEKIFDQP